MTNSTTKAASLFYARVAGFSYLLIIITAILNVTFIDSKIIISGNDAATSSNILANDLLFRSSIVLVLIIYASVAVLSHSLYVILKTVNKNIALLAMILRSIEATLGSVTALMSFFMVLLLNGENYSTVFEPEQLQALVGLFLNVRTAGLDIVLIFVGLGGTLFCYLFFKSNLVPRILASWGIFTYLSMLLLAFISILFPNHPAMIETVLYGLGTIFELILGFWLLFKGVNVEQYG
jgi:hypothetical protein